MKSAALGFDSANPPSNRVNFRDAVVLGARSAAVVIGLPKHSSPDWSTRERRVKNLQLLLVSLSPNALNLTSMPIQLVWESRGGKELEATPMQEDMMSTVRRDNEQILEAICFPSPTAGIIDGEALAERRDKPEVDEDISEMGRIFPGPVGRPKFG